MSGVEAASAVIGIVAFGLQVSQGLVNFYNAWKDRDKEVAEICASLDNLNSILKVLNETIQKLPKDDARFKDSMSGSLKIVENAMKDLKNKLEEINGEENPGMGQAQGKLQRMWKSRKIRSTLYPFQRSTLEKIQQSITDARSNLAFTLEVFQVDALSDIRPDIKLLVRWKEDEETKRILQWLSPVNFWLKQQDVQRQRKPGTGQWLLDHPQFLECVSGNVEMLLCVGSPGVGKTVLASTIIDFLEDDLAAPDIGLAFVYCNHKDNMAQNTEYFLAAIARHLVERSPALPTDLRDLYQRHVGKGTSPSLQDLKTLLPSISKNYSEVYIIIDALDECIDKNERMVWTALLTNLRNVTSTKLRLICTSREIEDNGKVLRGAMRIDIRASDSDIEAFIRAQLQPGEGLFELIEDYPDMTDKIVQNVVAKAEGIFLAAQLYIGYLAESTNLGKLKRALNSLPPTLDDNYREAMNRIERKHERDGTRALGLKALAWVIYATSPLSPMEMQHALAIDDWEPDDSTFDINDFLPPHGKIVNACAGLIRINAESNTVTLVHKTTYDYFKRTMREHFPTASEDIPMACVKYLSWNSFEENSDFWGGIQSAFETNALLRYAAVNLAYHFPADATKYKDLMERTMELVLDEKKLLNASKVVYALSYPPIYFQCNGGFTALHLAAHTGMKDIVESLLETGRYDIECKAIDEYTPLAMAALGGHVELVRFLLDSLQLAGKDRVTSAFDYAIRGRKTKVITVLMETYKTDVDKVEKAGKSLLFRAAKKIDVSLFRVMLARSKEDPNKNYGRESQSLLHRAISNADPDIAFCLIDNDNVNLEQKDLHGRSPLWLAVFHGRQSICKRLIEKGVDINTADDTGWTPLHLAATSGDSGRLKILLDDDRLELNPTTEDGLTPLHLAVHEYSPGSHLETLKMLLDSRRIEIDTRDDDGETPLSRASELGNESAVRLLLDTGKVNVNNIDKSNMSPLAYAMKKGNQAIIKMLQDAGGKVHPEQSSS